MTPIAVSVLRDGLVIAEDVAMNIERNAQLEMSTYSAAPHYRYDAVLQYPLPGGYVLRMNDYLRDELNTDNVTGSPLMYQVVNQPEKWPDGHYEFEVDDAPGAEAGRQ